jgi:hypothetical protein
MHALADQHLAQHRPDRRLAVAAARERRPAGALQGDVAAPAGAVDHLAEQHRPAVAELRREAAELMAGIRLGDRLGAFGHGVAGEEGGAGFARQRGGVETELLGQRRVEEQRLRRRRGLRAPGHGESPGGRGRRSFRGGGKRQRHGGTEGLPRV